MPEALNSLSLTSEMIRAARALLRWEQRNLAEASSVSLPTIKRLESRPGPLVAHTRPWQRSGGRWKPQGLSLRTAISLGFECAKFHERAELENKGAAGPACPCAARVSH